MLSLAQSSLHNTRSTCSKERTRQSSASVKRTKAKQGSLRDLLKEEHMRELGRALDLVVEHLRR